MSSLKLHHPSIQHMRSTLSLQSARLVSRHLAHSSPSAPTFDVSECIHDDGQQEVEENQEDQDLK